MRSRAGVYRAVWNFSWERLDSNRPSYPGDMLDTYMLIDSQPDTCLTHGVRNRLLASPSMHRSLAPQRHMSSSYVCWKNWLLVSGGSLYRDLLHDWSQVPGKLGAKLP